MEGHGFACWTHVPDSGRICLRCTCWKQKNQYVADRIVVKLYYEDDLIVSEDVAFETDVEHYPEHSLLPRFDP